MPHRRKVIPAMCLFAVSGLAAGPADARAIAHETRSVRVAARMPARARDARAASRSRTDAAARRRTPGTGSIVPGDLLVSASTYPSSHVTITPGQTELPPNCGPGATNDGSCTAAVAPGDEYPQVFNNATVDGSFGVTSPIALDELDRSGRMVGRIPVPAASAANASNGMTTSFSSKSELSLHLSTGGRAVTFMGYAAPAGAIDVSNSDTPGVDNPATNPAKQGYYRVVGELGTNGRLRFTDTNAFSGDNGRAAILNDQAGVLYMAGNAADESGASTPAAQAPFIESSGAQITTPGQAPGAPTPVGSFSVSELGLSEGGNVAKENNYRGMTVHDNVLYYTKGSGGKGISTVYFVDTTGKACPNGYGVPQPGAPLPTAPLGEGHFAIDSTGRLSPYNMCVLAGFPQILNGDNPVSSYPFGLWFANDHTLYVADEGNGNGPTNGDYSAADPTNNPTAGLQKWVYDPAAQAWHLAYTLQTGLNLGRPYPVAGGYPTGTNSATVEPWAPATDGLRDITGRVNPRNGMVTIYGVTATVSGSGDQGADPNRLVTISDRVGAVGPAPRERFRTLRTAQDGTIYRGVSFTPGTRRD